MTKGQTALEYLMTYGWAILIVIIVGASLYSLGVFSPGTWTGKRTTGFAQFQIVDFKFSTAGNLTLVVGNRLGKSVSLDHIVATYKQGTCNIPIGETIGPNIQKSYSLNTVTCTSNSTNWPSAGDLRTSYNILLDLYYVDPESTLSHIDSGNLFGAIES